MNFNFKSLTNTINIIIFFISIFSIFLFSMGTGVFSSYLNCFFYCIILISMIFFIFENYKNYQKNKNIQLYFTYGKSFIWHIQLNHLNKMSPLLLLMLIYFISCNDIYISLVYILVVILSLIQYQNIIVIILTLLSSFDRLVSMSLIYVLSIPNIMITGNILHKNISDINQEIFLFICLSIVMFLNSIFFYYLIKKSQN